MRTAVTGMSWAVLASRYFRAIAVAWSLVLIGLIATGTLTKARPGTFIWAPTLDIWAASIAISDINFGLRGGLAYREIVQKMTSFFPGGGFPVTDPRSIQLVQQPQLVDQAIKASAAMTRGEVTDGVAEDGGYALLYPEDIGYADLYELGFKIFGFSAFATHYLYIAILTGSFLLFAAARWRSNASIAIGTITIGAIFLATNSAIISALVPTVASNRFLTTLALIPTLHLLLTALDRSPLTAGQFLMCLGQMIIAAFAVLARSSAMWCVLALVAVTLAITFWRRPSLLREAIQWVRRKVEGALHHLAH